MAGVITTWTATISVTTTYGHTQRKVEVRTHSIRTAFGRAAETIEEMAAPGAQVLQAVIEVQLKQHPEPRETESWGAWPRRR